VNVYCLEMKTLTEFRHIPSVFLLHLDVTT